MNIDSEMKYIQSWSTALLEICEKLRKILDSWDASLPSDSNIKSNNILSITDSFNTLALKDIASTVLNLGNRLYCNFYISCELLL